MMLQMKNNVPDEKEVRWLLEEKYAGIVSSAYEEDLGRLEQGEPLAYLIGNVPFLGAHIDLEFRTLIPRTETEFWVQRVLEKMPHVTTGETVRCLDIFSGSGCIGIAVLTHRAEYVVDFADYDPRAIAQIKKNISLNHIDESRCRVFQSDIFADIPEGRYDYIFANPPYIPSTRRESLDTSVVAHEPHEALFSGIDGLDCIRRLLSDLASYLSPTGTLYLEFDCDQKESIEQLCIEQHLACDCYKDQSDRWRYAEIRLT